MAVKGTAQGWYIGEGRGGGTSASRNKAARRTRQNRKHNRVATFILEIKTRVGGIRTFVSPMPSELNRIQMMVPSQ